MPRTAARYAETKPQRHVRRDTGQAKPPPDPVKQAFEECWARTDFGASVSAKNRALLFFRVGAEYGQREANRVPH